MCEAVSLNVSADDKEGRAFTERETKVSQKSQKNIIRLLIGFKMNFRSLRGEHVG
jgi:hypothetical protein